MSGRSKPIVNRAKVEEDGVDEDGGDVFRLQGRVSRDLKLLRNVVLSCYQRLQSNGSAAFAEELNRAHRKELVPACVDEELAGSGVAHDPDADTIALAAHRQFADFLDLGEIDGVGEDALDVRKKVLLLSLRERRRQTYA